MGLEDLSKQAGEFVKDSADKIKDGAGRVTGKISDAVHSEQAENISDKVLDGVAGAANKITGGKFEEQVQGVRDSVDKHIGTE